MNKNIRNIDVLKPLFVIRDWAMNTFHLFFLKKKIKHKLFIHRLMVEDAAKKRRIDSEIYAMPDNIFTGEYSPDDIIVSLTSYGKRVVDVLPYALYSIITQTQRPKKVVVYLDWDNWNDEKLPDILKKLQKVGVDFRYCEDLRSFKKLIPALKDFPNNPITTIDDDMYYHPHFVENVQSAYLKSDRKTILGYAGAKPISLGGKYFPYNEWKNMGNNDKDDAISFIGYEGVCYPPHIFDKEILNQSLFMSLCPTADDIWFWAMEERQNIKRKYILPYLKHAYVNQCEEYLENVEDTLMHINSKKGGNNEQFEAVIEHYGLKPQK